MVIKTFLNLIVLPADASLFLIWLLLSSVFLLYLTFDVTMLCSVLYAKYCMAF